MKKIFAISCIVLMVFGACKRETKDEHFRKEFEQFTLKECPKFLDECTRQDSAVYDIETRTLNYCYTVQGALDNDDIYTEALVSDHRKNILRGLKNSIQLKPYKDENIIFRYVYRSISTGKIVLELTFTPEDYN